MTEKELKLLATDIVRGFVFTSDMIHKDVAQATLPGVFLPLALMTHAERQAFIDEGPSLLYEYLNKAGPIESNGYPCFFSFRHLVLADHKKLHEYVRQLSDELSPP